MLNKIRDWLMKPVVSAMENLMADVSPLLTQLAQDLRAFGEGPFTELVARNAALEARNAELEGEDSAESAAAESAVSAYNEIAARVTRSPEVPEEIPPVQVPPADGEPASV